jgi:GNAT superfamily N-acetyltransferase
MAHFSPSGKSRPVGNGKSSSIQRGLCRDLLKDGNCCTSAAERKVKIMSTAGTAVHDEAAESIAQAVALWRWLVNPGRGGEMLDSPGLFIGSARTLWPLGNCAVVTTAITDAAEFEARITRGASFFDKRAVTGLFVVCDALVPQGLREAVPAVFARFGYVPAMSVMGMAANRILPRIRPLPTLRFEPGTDARDGEMMARLNCIAYGVPLEWAPDWEARTGLSESQAFGLIAYANGEPFACACTVVLLNCLYVGIVATHPDHRKRGCAEAVLRHSLQAAARKAGLTRTVLHASDMGRPLYAQIGYHDAVPFTFYGRHSE